VVYESVSDALRDLVKLKDRGGIISKFPKRITVLSNGQPYYYVEVMCKDRSCYVIEAVGKDAIKLMEECMKHTSTEEIAF
jgi:hypothetical protein